MNYINIENGVQLRDQGRNGKGHLHAKIEVLPGRVIVEQSQDQGQIIQRVIHPNGELVITCFAKTTDEKPKKLHEVTIYLWEDKGGDQK